MASIVNAEEESEDRDFDETVDFESENSSPSIAATGCTEMGVIAAQEGDGYLSSTSHTSKSLGGATNSFSDEDRIRPCSMARSTLRRKRRRIQRARMITQHETTRRRMSVTRNVKR